MGKMPEVIESLRNYLIENKKEILFFIEWEMKRWQRKIVQM